jgi:type II secretory ATPase GspE/PulE/Tfp pilus assembly ATPase PilB-like protein
MELLTMTHQMKDLVHHQASPLELKKAAAATGFKPIQHDALNKLLAGVITLEGYVECLM